uniref:Uncharacterized protein n=1 Tax=Anguilla anguilla TaxID=7936 RepID=A0A0E9RS55_ANGAN
MILSRILTQVD